MANLEIYVLSVGEGDATLLKTPGGQVIVIDAHDFDKCDQVLEHIGPPTPPDLPPDKEGEIDLMVISHAHWDHCSGAQSILQKYRVRRVCLAPFWVYPGATGYRALLNQILGIDTQGNPTLPRTPMRCVSGYERFYPDGGAYPEFAGAFRLELVGPPNDILEQVSEAGDLTPNHASIMAVLRQGSFKMVIAADAQMENWAQFDRENMGDGGCTVLRTSHHGSKNGTQYERLERLKPQLAIVSSQPDGRHDIPDLTGTSILYHYHKTYSDNQTPRKAVMTSDTGTLRIVVQPGGSWDVESYGEAYDSLIPMDSSGALVAPSAPPDPDWATHLKNRWPFPTP